jgi:hypothetical protein
MNLKEAYSRIRHDHSLMMVICCMVPLALLYTAVYVFGVSKGYLYWSIILLCPLMHFIMMKDMCKSNSESCDNHDKKEKEGAAECLNSN